MDTEALVVQSKLRPQEQPIQQGFIQSWHKLEVFKQTWIFFSKFEQNLERSIRSKDAVIAKFQQNLDKI